MCSMETVLGDTELKSAMMTSWQKHLCSFHISEADFCSWFKIYLKNPPAAWNIKHSICITYIYAAADNDDLV